MQEYAGIWLLTTFILNKKKNPADLPTGNGRIRRSKIKSGIFVIYIILVCGCVCTWKAPSSRYDTFSYFICILTIKFWF